VRPPVSSPVRGRFSGGERFIREECFPLDQWSLLVERNLPWIGLFVLR
jgi:hypothetical protein